MDTGKRKESAGHYKSVCKQQVILLLFFIFMKREEMLNIRYVIILLLATVQLSAVFTGCAGQGFKPRNMAVVSGYFDLDTATVWGAVIESFAGVPLDSKDKERGFVRTQWIMGWTDDKSMGLLLEGRWQKRYRLFVRVTGEHNKTYVSVNAQIEEKAPGGSQAYRWSRVPSDGIREREFMAKLENILNSQRLIQNK